MSSFKNTTFTKNYKNMNIVFAKEDIYVNFKKKKKKKVSKELKF